MREVIAVANVLERPKVVSESITPEMMRVAMRRKLRGGVNKQQICWVVWAYAPADATNDRTEGSVLRLPVETIPTEKRRAFLDALSPLPDLHPPHPQEG